MFSPVLLKITIFLFVSLRNIYYICYMNKDTLIGYINQGLSTWKIAEELNTTQPNIRYWLKKYSLQTLRTTNSINNDRTCLSCNTIKPQEQFYKRGKKYMSHCISCFLKNNTTKRQAVKQQCVDYLGGKCSKCGYDKCLAALDFHHLDITQKDKTYVNNRMSFDKLKPELDKCVLLCANCHREEHHLLATDI